MLTLHLWETTTVRRLIFVEVKQTNKKKMHVDAFIYIMKN